ncbi:11381_t:CDS:2, partial [Racocetra persica]
SNNFKQLIETEEPQLIGFLDEMTNALLNNFYCFNINDFHDIHTLRQPNNTTLSTANHLATCVTKPIENQQPILAILNNHSFF